MARLGSLATTNYVMLDGYATAHNMPPLENLPLGRFINFVYWYFMKNASEKDVEAFRAKLWQPPKTVKKIDKRSPWAPENETKAFSQLKALTSGGAGLGTKSQVT